LPGQLLCFGRDEMLLKTRMWLLEKHAPIALAADYRTFLELVEKTSYQVAILCHTLMPEERKQAVELLTRVSQETTIVCLTPASGGIWNQLPSEDDCISVEGSAMGLIRAVVPLLRGSTAADPSVEE
jgi:hypothetical protein